MAKTKDDVRNEFYEAVIGTVERGLRARGVEAGDARQIGMECVAEIKSAVGGCFIYFPRGVKEARLTRNARIFADFTGANFSELAQKYGISEIAVRTAIAGVRVARRKGESF